MSFGEELGKAAYEVAKNMGNTKSLGKCALAVGNALAKVITEQKAVAYRGNAYTWLAKVRKSPYWKFLKQSSDTTNLPAGSLVIWDRQDAHPYGHIEIADGNGHLCSDFIRSDKLALYKSNPAKIVPQIFVPAEVEVSKFPCKVQVICSALNIRKDADTSSEIVAKVTQGTILTVWGVVTKGDRQWGKNSTGYFALFDSNEVYVKPV